MSGAPSISVVMPAYNAARVVTESCESLLKQSYEDFELVVVDDCSRDHTQDILRDLSRRDSRIRPVFSDVNQGSGAARRAGLEHCRGRYLAFLDSDDLWPAHKLERQLEFMRAGQHAFVFTAYRRFIDDSTRCGRLIEVPAQMNFRQALRETAIATSTVIIDREQVRDIRIQSVYHDDFVLWLSILQRGVTAIGLNEDLMRYRVSSSSKSSNRLRMAKMVWVTYRDVLRLSIPDAAWCFVNYAARASLKHARF